jgi:hypothetical protein
MGILLVIAGLACVAWIIHREVVERERHAAVRRGERRVGAGRAFWDGFRRGIRIWVLGGGGVMLLALGITQLAGT